MLAPGTVRVNSANFMISDMSFEVPRRLSIVVEGTLRVVELIGRERMAWRWFSYCEVSHTSVV
jgi:hypothetical protein